MTLTPTAIKDDAVRPEPFPWAGAPFFVRITVTAIALMIWFWGQRLIGARGNPDPAIGDRLHALTAPANLYLHVQVRVKKWKVSRPFFEYLLNIFLRCENDVLKNLRMVFSTLATDTSDTFFVVNRGRWRFWEATDPKLRNGLKPA